MKTGRSTWRKIGCAAVLAGFLLILMCGTASAATGSTSASRKNEIASARESEGGRWVKDTKGLKYRRPDGSYVTNSWIRAHGFVYRIGPESYARKGWFYASGELYYADAHCRVYYSRWLDSAKGRYYFKADGRRVLGQWYKIGGDYYYFFRNGVMAANTLINGAYCAGPDGARVMGGWARLRDKDYYFFANGQMAKDVFIGNYYVSPNGARYAGRWLEKNGKNYYFGEDGLCYKSAWKEIDGKTYYFFANGQMAKDVFVDGCYVDSAGVRAASGWLDRNGNRYYLDGEGKYVKSTWYVIDGREYYFMANGQMARNMFLSRYYVDSDGVKLADQWLRKGGKRYYLGSDGKYVVGWKTLDGIQYYFNADGTMAANEWVGMYYMKEDGTPLTNAYQDGYWLDENGVRFKQEYHGEYLYVGDSRVAQMTSFVPQDRCVFIAQGGATYSWLKGTASRVLRYYLEQKADSKVILALGINDLYDVESYVSGYRALMNEYPQAAFYVLSVNPIVYEKISDEEIREKPTVEKILQFNERMRQEFPDQYIDLYTYLMETGFSTRDGLHYDGPTCVRIYRYVMDKVG